MSSIFQPPVAFTQPRVLPRTKGPARRLWSRYSARPVGRTVLKINGTYGVYDTPTIDQIASASEAYQGGHLYTVSDAVAAALTAAGFGAGLS